MIVSLMLAAAAAAAHPAHSAEPVEAPSCDTPVLMVVTGTTHDRERMLAYGQAIADSRLYEELGGYYVNIPRRLAVFEGEPDPGHVDLIVRFPCLANARAFWNSRVYQREILPLRQDPSAGDYAVIVYEEAPLRADLAGKVGDADYLVPFRADAVVQAEPSE